MKVKPHQFEHFANQQKRLSKAAFWGFINLSGNVFEKGTFYSTKFKKS